jgi:hypothetical protein
MLGDSPMPKIKVIKSGKEATKPSNYCPWLVDTDAAQPASK